MRRYGAKRDANEGDILKQLRDIPGLSVFQLSQPKIPDLLIGWQGKTYIADVKNKRGHWTPLQEQFIEEWTGSPVIWANTLEDILEAIGLTGGR